MSRGNDARCRLSKRHLRAFATETTGELDVLGLDGDTEDALEHTRGQDVV